MTTSTDLNKLFCYNKRTKRYKVAKPLAPAEIISMARQLLTEQCDNSVCVTHAEMAKQFFILQLAEETREVFACLFLDSQHRKLGYDCLFYGTINQNRIYPREVLRKALAYNASAVIVAHNHPSGNPKPSKEDIFMTQHLKEILSLVEIRLLDHIVVSGGEAISLGEKGHIKEDVAPDKLIVVKSFS